MAMEPDTSIRITVATAHLELHQGGAALVLDIGLTQCVPSTQHGIGGVMAEGLGCRFQGGGTGLQLTCEPRQRLHGLSIEGTTGEAPGTRRHIP